VDIKKLCSLLMIIILSMPALIVNAVCPISSEEPIIFAGNSADVQEYRLGKYDTIDILIYGVDDEHYKDVVIGPDGYIRLPFAGGIKVEGLTIRDATALVREKLDPYLVINDMAIMMKGYGQREVYVMGEVKNSGVQKLTWDRMNVIDAISSAGGVLYKGRPKHILITRAEDGKLKRWKVNYDDLIRKADLSQNIHLKDNDLVYVPKADRKIDFYSEVMPILQSVYYIHAITD